MDQSANISAEDEPRLRTAGEHTRAPQREPVAGGTGPSPNQAAAERRLRLLLAAGSALADAPEAEPALVDVARLMARAWNTGCVVDLVEEEGGARPLAVLHPDARTRRRLRETFLHQAPEEAARRRVARAQEARRPALITEEPAAVQAGGSRAVEPALLVPVLLVPLRSRDRLLGAMTFVPAPPSFTADDQAWVEDLARRCAAAVERQRLRRDAGAVAQQRDQILSFIAHDLKSPLQTIALGTTLHADPRLPEAKRTDYAARVQQAVGRMNRLIEGLLLTARGEAQTQTLNRQPVQVEALITRAVEMCSGAPKARPLDLNLQLAAALPVLQADRECLLRVLLMVLEYATERSPAGGCIHLSVRETPDGVFFCVADAGPRLSEEQRVHLFDWFWQAQPARAHERALDLASCRGLVEAHGGRIWAEDGEEGGARFCFCIPVRAAAP